MNERWVPVHGFPGYEVSDLGRIRSWKPKGNSRVAPTEPRILRLRPNPSRGGFLVVTLSNEHRMLCTKLVNRLVLEAFVGPPPDDAYEARHVENHVVTDNRLLNLKWVSRYAQRTL